VCGRAGAVRVSVGAFGRPTDARGSRRPWRCSSLPVALRAALCRTPALTFYHGCRWAPALCVDEARHAGQQIRQGAVARRAWRGGPRRRCGHKFFLERKQPGAHSGCAARPRAAAGRHFNCAPPRPPLCDCWTRQWRHCARLLDAGARLYQRPVCRSG